MAIYGKQDKPTIECVRCYAIVPKEDSVLVDDAYWCPECHDTHEGQLCLGCAFDNAKEQKNMDLSNVLVEEIVRVKQLERILDQKELPTYKEIVYALDCLFFAHEKDCKLNLPNLVKKIYIKAK